MNEVWGPTIAQKALTVFLDTRVSSGVWCPLRGGGYQPPERPNSISLSADAPALLPPPPRRAHTITHWCHRPLTKVASCAQPCRAGIHLAVFAGFPGHTWTLLCQPEMLTFPALCLIRAGPSPTILAALLCSYTREMIPNGHYGCRPEGKVLFPPPPRGVQGSGEAGPTQAEGLSSRKGTNCVLPPRSRVPVSKPRSKEILKLQSTIFPTRVA